ncbi:hypothetical protein BKA69DRAFT_1125426 [Paraphysoderma sedebokerense]|nr:hypothetical protein BKA69DRAFT_1125426 [Paraphysoderma sedebokerense]
MNNIQYLIRPSIRFNLTFNTSFLSRLQFSSSTIRNQSTKIFNPSSRLPSSSQSYSTSSSLTSPLYNSRSTLIQFTQLQPSPLQFLKRMFHVGAVYDKNGRKTERYKAMLKAKQRRLRRGKTDGPPKGKATFQLNNNANEARGTGLPGFKKDLMFIPSRKMTSVYKRALEMRVWN